MYKIIFLLLLSSCGIFSENLSEKELADKYTNEKEYIAAIDSYKKHIEKRLNVENKPEWENPYIYYLDIGDIYLEQDKIDKALENYLIADKNKVKDTYVNDRLRNVASYYESKGKLNDAIEHLEKYKERDLILFNLMLDRLIRQLVKKEDNLP